MRDLALLCIRHQVTISTTGYDGLRINLMKRDTRASEIIHFAEVEDNTHRDGRGHSNDDEQSLDAPRKLKYITYKGYVKSTSDGKIHYLSHRRLIDLYGVDPRETMDGSGQGGKEAGQRLKLIALPPRRDGRYTLPKK